jgi:hypothetical protein
MERQPSVFGIESDHSPKMKPMRLYQHPQVSLDIADPLSAVMVPKQLLCRVGTTACSELISLFDRFSANRN